MAKIKGKAAFFTNFEKSKVETDMGPYQFDLRPGAEEDKKNFESVFFTTFGLEPLTGNKDESSIKNLTSIQWKPDTCTSNRNCMCWVCKLEYADYSNCEYVLLGFSSHGNEELFPDGVREPSVILTDGKLLSLSKIVKAMDIESLKDKPKILMLQSCRVYEKSPEVFSIENPVVKETTTNSMKPLVVVYPKDDTNVGLRVTTQAGVKDYEVQQATKKTKAWTQANLIEVKKEKESTDITVGNLQSDTTYCFVVRAKHDLGRFGPFSNKLFVITSEAEDEGVEINVRTTVTTHETVKADSDDNDGVLSNTLKKVLTGPFQAGSSNTQQPGGSNTQQPGGSGDPQAGSSNTQPMNIKKGRFQKQPVTIVSEDSNKDEAMKEVFTPDNLPKDFLIVYGTTRGRVAKRHDKHGSWMMQALTRVVTEEEEGKELNVLNLLTKAARLMADKTSEHETIEKLRNKKNILSFSHTLTESIIFKKIALSKPALF